MISKGQPIVPLFAELSMRHIENTCLSSLNTFLFYYGRHVDVIFCNASSSDIENIINNVSHYYPSLKITFELEVDRLINFLHISITVEDSVFFFCY